MGLNPIQFRGHAKFTALGNAGGASRSMTTGAAPGPENYMVSDRDHEKVVPYPATEAQTAAHHAKLANDTTTDDRHYQGMWRENDKVYFDRSRAHADFHDAIREGYANTQKAIFKDLGPGPKGEPQHWYPALYHPTEFAGPAPRAADPVPTHNNMGQTTGAMRVFLRRRRDPQEWPK